MDKQSDFKPVLGFWVTVLAFGVGSLIGGGLFGLTGIATGHSGPAFLLVIVLLAFINFPTVMAYAELGLAIPDTGGGYAWIKMAYGSTLGHFAGWGSWGAHTVACTVYAMNIGYYSVAILTAYIPYGKEISSQVESLLPISFSILIGVIFIAWLTIISLRGARSSGRFGMYLVILLIAILIAYVVLGVVNMFLDITATSRNFSDLFPKGGWGVILAMSNFALAYQGSEIVAQGVKEIKDPKKNLRKALFISYGIIVGLYIVVIFAALAGTHGEIASWQILKDAGEGAIAKGASFFPFAFVLVPIILGAGFVASLAALNSTIFSSSHAAVALSIAKSIPGRIGKLDEKGTPKVAVVLSACGMVFMIVVLPLEEVAAVANLLFIFLFLWLNAALIKLRISRPEITRPYKVPLFPWLNIAAIIGYAIIAIPLFSVSAKGLLIVVLWFIIGGFLWSLFAKKNIEEDIAGATIYKVFMPLGPETQAKVFCPLMKGTNWKVMLYAAYNIARFRRTGLYVCLLQDLPHGVTTFQEFDILISSNEKESSVRHAEKERMLQDAIDFYGEVVEELKSYPQKLSLRYISAGVTDTPPAFEQIERVGYEQMISRLVEMEDADVLIVPFEHIERWKRGFAWATLTRVLRQTSCHLMVVKTGFAQELPKESMKCLVPYAPGPHKNLLLDTISAFRGSLGGQFACTFIHIRGQKESAEKVEHMKNWLVSRGITDSEIEFLQESEDIGELILEKAKGYDLIMLAASKEDSFKEIEFGKTVEEILNRSSTPAIVVHRHQDFWYPLAAMFVNWSKRSQNAIDNSIASRK